MVIKEITSTLVKMFLLSSIYTEYSIPDRIAKKKAWSKSKFTKVSTPTNKTIPRMAMTVPIQKLVVGLSFKKKNVPTPTQTGDKLVRRVACVAVDCCMATFHTATSVPKIIPQSTDSHNIFLEGILNFLVNST